MALSWNEIRNRAIAFSREWENETSEHAEAKSFWDGFFYVFGVSRRRVAAFEKHVHKASGADGFIDLFWPGHMLAEHKSKGKDLGRAFDQAIDYFPGLKDKELPRYVVVSDFARIRIHDLDTDQETEFELKDFHKHVEQFGFISGYQAREFKEQDPVNIKAAEQLGKLHDALADIGYEGHQLEVYLVRLLFCMFAEDTGIFMPAAAFEDYLHARTSDDGADLAARLNELFDTLNTHPDNRFKNLDEQLADFPYVNGKLFEENLRTASFDATMRQTLLDCCALDWGQISPAIFGSLFQGIMDPQQRRNLGAHYTSEKNILKLIGPLFLDDLKVEFKKANSKPKLQAFHEKLARLQFFDPACGCGNFLVITYRELRLLELEVIKKLYFSDTQQLSLDAVDTYVKVNVDQFHGIEIEEWPSQIARVAMWLIDHQMNVLVGQTFGQAIVRIPLVKSANIVHGNALTLDWEEVIASERCHYVLGNPPFVGAKYMNDAQRADSQSVFAGIKSGGLLDFVAAWYVKAAEYLGDNNKAAFVSTNSICQGEQVGVLWPPLFEAGITIHFAHRTFQWNNEARGKAAVHCVIIGFGRQHSAQRTIFDYSDIRGEPTATEASNINPYLVDAPFVDISKRSKPLCDIPSLKFGNQPVDGGHLILTPEERSALLQKEPLADKYIRRFLGGAEFLQNKERYCLWLQNAQPSDLKKLPMVLERINKVKEFREASKRTATQELAKTPTQFAFISHENSDYLVVPKATSGRRNFVPVGFMKPSTIVSDLCLIAPRSELFHFGVLSSSMHNSWIRYVAGRLKSDYRYSVGIVYNNFPWPVDANEKHKQAIETAAQDVLDARALFPQSSLADLYDPLTMPPALVKAHQSLDKAVDAAYVPSGGKKSWASDAERVAFLFELYQQMTTE